MARGDYYSGIFGPAGGRLNAPAANPFQAAAQSDPWSGLRQAGQIPLPATQSPLTQPTSRKPSYSPLTDPNGPLARAGWIGALLAQGPTKGEYLAEKLGMAQQAALSGIGLRLQGGMTPQRAILDFANSPEGVDFFTSGGGFTDLANVAKGLTPPVEENVVMSPGQELRGSTTGALVASVPPSDVTKFNAMTDLAGLTDQEKQQMAQATLLKDTTGDLSAAEGAMNRLVAGGRIKQETADLILGGVLTTKPILDEAGKTIGYGVVDLSSPDGSIKQLPTNGQAPGQLPQPNSRDYAPGVTPGTEPEKQPDNGPMFEGMTDPADIVDAAGPIGWLIGRFGPLFGNYDPSMAGNETVQKRNALGRIMADAAALAKDGKVLKSEMDDIRALSDTLGIMQSPISVAEKLLAMHDAYDNADKVLAATIANPNSTAKNIGDARIEQAAIRRAKANMPTRQSLLAKKERLGAMQPGAALKEAVTGAEEAVTKTEKNLGVTPPEAKAPGAAGPQDYGQDAARLRKDWENGKLRKGDTVIINGQTRPITEDYRSK